MKKETKTETQQQSDNDVSQALKDGITGAEPKTLATIDKAPIEAHGATRPGIVAGFDVGDVGTGFEDFTQNDVAVPFIAILQKGSPQVEEDNPKYITGAKPGMFFNTVTNEIFSGKEGIVVIPVHRVRSFIEWIPKDDGGGLVNVFEPDAPEVGAVLAKAGRKFGKLKIGDNNDLVETFSVFCLLDKGDGRTERVIVSFASSQIGGYKKWMTAAQSIQIQDEETGKMKVPPMFSHRYRLTTFFFQKREFTWYKYLAAFADSTAEASRLGKESELFEQAKEFRAMVMSGRAQIAYESAVQDAGEGAGESEYEM